MTRTSLTAEEAAEVRRAAQERMAAERRARIEKLPRWARDDIHRLERAAEELRLSLEEARGTRSLEGAVAVRDAYRDPVPVAWDKYDTIRFTLVEGDVRNVVDVHLDHDGRGLMLRAPYGNLVLRPSSSNTATASAEVTG